MKILYLALIISTLLFPLIFIHDTPVKAKQQERFYPRHNPIVMIQKISETETEAQIAWDQFNEFAKQHNLIALYRHPAADVWDLALTVDENTEPKWAVYGFKTLTEAVNQIESDYKTYPNGHNVK